MRRMTLTACAAIAVAALAGCGSSGGTAAQKAPTSPTSARATPTSTPTPTHAVSPNVAACSKAQDYVTDKVKTTFGRWDVNANEFNPKVGEQLRAEGTHLYAIANNATGSVASAITDEAKGLIGISVAIDETDADALGSASNDANTALATLRGACNF